MKRQLVSHHSMTVRPFMSRSHRDSAEGQLLDKRMKKQGEERAVQAVKALHEGRPLKPPTRRSP